MSNWQNTVLWFWVSKLTLSSSFRSFATLKFSIMQNIWLGQTWVLASKYYWLDEQLIHSVAFEVEHSQWLKWNILYWPCCGMNWVDVQWVDQFLDTSEFWNVPYNCFENWLISLQDQPQDQNAYHKILTNDCFALKFSAFINKRSQFITV